MILQDEILPYFYKQIERTSLDIHGIINRNFYAGICNQENEVEKIGRATRQWIELYGNNISENSPMSLFGGISELGLSLWSVSRKNGMYFIELNKIDRIIYQKTENYISMIKEQKIDILDVYDSVSGLSGIANYCLVRKDNLGEIVEAIIDLFIRQTLSDKSWQINKLVVNRENEIEQMKCYDLGLAHGVAGPLSLMINAYTYGYRNNGLIEAINTLIEMYLELLEVDPHSIPSIIGVNKRCIQQIERDSWSYGSSSILWIMMKALKILKSKKTQKIKELILDRFKSYSSLHDYKFISPTVLNGYSGMLALQRQIFKETGDIYAKNQISKLYNHIIDKFDLSSEYGYKHFEYKLTANNEWIVESYDLSGFAYGTIGVLMILTDSEASNLHLLI